jgi:hypothetical protein
MLCRERLDRLLAILDSKNGRASIRDLSRSYRMYCWEIEQAADLGWVKIETYHPPVGRPSRRIEKLSNNEVAKLPPYREQIPSEINFRHHKFALGSINIMPGGDFGFKLSTLVLAYMKTFPNARSRKGAYASASRLAKRFEVKLMKHWYRLTMAMPQHEPMPNTIQGIINRLRTLGLL